jgi:hypothetical protein
MILEEGRDIHVKTEVTQAKDRHPHPRLAEAGKVPPIQECDPVAGMLVLDFWPPEPENKSLSLKPLGL